MTPKEILGITKKTTRIEEVSSLDKGTGEIYDTRTHFEKCNVVAYCDLAGTVINKHKGFLVKTDTGFSIVCYRSDRNLIWSLWKHNYHWFYEGLKKTGVIVDEKLWEEYQAYRVAEAL